jgi:hypothetical protein
MELIDMKKAMLIAMLQILIAIFILNGMLLAGETSIDESFGEKTYYEKGVPEKFQNLDDFALAYNSFWEIAEKNKKNLPKYNSKKSGILFHKLFNKSYVENIIKSDLQSRQKRELLSKYSMMYSGFTDIYSLNNPENLYENEIIRLSSLKAYSIISAYKILDQEISDNNLELSAVFGKPEEKVMFITKMIGREFWGLSFKIDKFDTIDSITKDFIRADIKIYEKLVSSIKFMDYDNNIKKIKSLY